MVKLSDNTYNFIDKQGNIISKQNFKWFGGFNEGFAGVQLSDDIWYYIDKTLNFYDYKTKTPVPNPFEKELNNGRVVFKYGDVVCLNDINLVGDYIKYENGRHIIKSNYMTIELYGDNIKLATKDEFQIKFKNGDLLFVKNDINGDWELKYTTGKLINNKIECYKSQKLDVHSNLFLNYYSYFKEAKNVKLPIE
jgi:hypothetical protein